MNVGKIIGIACAIFAGIKSVWALEQISVSENIAAAVSGSKADIGIAYADSSGYWQSSTRKYPLLSVFKLHVAVAVLAMADKENIPLDTLINVSAAEINKDMYSPMLQKYGVENFSLPLRELLRYMVAESDNNACDILIRRLGGIKSVFLTSDMVSVTKESNASWEDLKPQILAEIMDFFATGEQAVVENNNNRDEEEIIKEITSLLNARIRPAIKQDGGDIEFKAFKKGVVYVELQGNCKGCPYALVTLKEGVEKILKTYIPEVKSVENYDKEAK